jgi:nucleotide-binding universal stress UspA family protein
MAGRPVVIAYDGSESAEHALREAGALLPGRKALVVAVWKAGVGLEAIELPASSMGLPPSALDVDAALDADRALYERAQRLAAHGTALATDAGFEAEALAVADEPAVSVAETLARLASEREAQAIVVGAHGHGRVGQVLLGSTSRDLIRHATCPVVVVRG